MKTNTWLTDVEQDTLNYANEKLRAFPPNLKAVMLSFFGPPVIIDFVELNYLERTEELKGVVHTLIVEMIYPPTIKTAIGYNVKNIDIEQARVDFEKYLFDRLEELQFERRTNIELRAAKLEDPYYNEDGILQNSYLEDRDQVLDNSEENSTFVNSTKIE